MLKSLNSAPKRLQRMFSHLHKYNLDVHYKRGDTLFVAELIEQKFMFVIYHTIWLK